MEMFSKKLEKSLESKNLLNHPYYQAWNQGKLTMDSLRRYARQYFHHVDAFPRYLSATHTNCEDIKARQILLENLVDEERGEKNHPELWMQFAEGLGESRESVLSEELLPQTQGLIKTFFELSQSSYEEGLGALHAYEQQTPEIAKTKIKGLKENYDICDDRTLEFFNVHQAADVWHSEETAQLLDGLTPEQQDRAGAAAHKAAQALWDFLDGVSSPEVQDC